jgi:putative ABC transport system ATP-binding protein
MLRLENVSKSFSGGGHTLTVLQTVDVSIETGEICAIIGPSGSGKTTLLGISAGLEKPTTGAVYLNNTNLNDLNEDQLAALRNQLVGFVFQSFHLIPSFTALENVMVPLELQGDKNARKAAAEMLAEVGLGERLHHYPVQLSGGEQQRVAIARAFVNQPRILFADEPTGNLDADNGAHVEELLFSLNKTYRTTLVIVTHNPELARKTDRIISIRGGRIVSDERLKTVTEA